ncbi:hypothetical protein VTN77DRAFT_2228 [Rasamsonia byssochlamydoides]|uniref:uncharacterized protein n=1 Tax=Rasamsonia byssochlamydoides TaxID=89139 RepID=UPI003742EF52
MMKKKEVYTNITPLPSFIPRQLALDILHSHSEIITLNPLVLEHHAIPAPRDASADEYYSTWYEITERIQYIPGLGKMGSGKISFRGCFHDVPWGLQTHIYAPLGVDLRNNWRVAGNQPGEPPEHRELGLGAPAEGLYLREDIEIKCNVTLVSFVKAQLKASTKVLVDRLIKKAELLDAGVLQAMMENGKLKTINPADRSETSKQQQLLLLQRSGSTHSYPASPTLGDYKRPGTASDPPLPSPNLLQYRPIPNPQAGPVAMELPGDMHYHQPQLSPKQMLLSSDRSDTNTAGGAWSESQLSLSSRPTSYSSYTSGFRSPGLDQKAFAAELPAMPETREEHVTATATTTAALKQLEANAKGAVGGGDLRRYRHGSREYAGLSGR